MKYAPALMLLASPALAHHEGVAVSLAPTAAIWALALSGVIAGLWRAWKSK